MNKWQNGRKFRMAENCRIADTRNMHVISNPKGQDSILILILLLTLIPILNPESGKEG